MIRLPTKAQYTLAISETLVSRHQNQVIVVESSGIAPDPLLPITVA